jgi:hypothetical protein
MHLKRRRGNDAQGMLILKGNGKGSFVADRTEFVQPVITKLSAVFSLLMEAGYCCKQ